MHTLGPLLVVDDNPHNLAAMRNILEGHYQLIFARDGEEALALARRQSPSLILLDVQMPGMDGYEVCRRLQADVSTRNIPVIFVTTREGAAFEAKGFDAGGVDYLTKPVVPALVKLRVKAHLSRVRASQLEDSYREAIYMLGTAGHYNDTDTGVHIWRMAAYSAALARASGWGDDECRNLELAAPMHDTGKIAIPDAILRKPGKLDEAEWVVMKTHTTIGHQILRKSHAPVFQLAAEVALNHHERWDGSGYPADLAGEAIPESARIVAIVDVFDALTMKRPYKDAWSVERALQTMVAESGKHFDPCLFATFQEIIPELLDIKANWDRLEASAAGEPAMPAPPPVDADAAGG